MDGDWQQPQKHIMTGTEGARPRPGHYYLNVKPGADLRGGGGGGGRLPSPSEIFQCSSLNIARHLRHNSNIFDVVYDCA